MEAGQLLLLLCLDAGWGRARLLGFKGGFGVLVSVKSRVGSIPSCADASAFGRYGRRHCSALFTSLLWKWMTYQVVRSLSQCLVLKTTPGRDECILATFAGKPLTPLLWASLAAAEATHWIARQIKPPRPLLQADRLCGPCA